MPLPPPPATNRQPIMYQEMTPKTAAYRDAQATQSQPNYGGSSAAAAPQPPAAPTKGGFNVFSTVEGDITKAGGEVYGGFMAVRQFTQGPSAPPMTVSGAPGSSERIQSLIHPGAQGAETAFVAAGIVPGGDLIFAGERVAPSLFTRLASNFSLGSAYGGITGALKGESPVQIGESAVIGGAVFSVAGKVGSTLAERFQASAASGRFAEISGEGASVSQRISMFLTRGSAIKPPPVAGVETFESGTPVQGSGQDIFRFPGASSVHGTGRLSESGFDIADIEGVNPVKRGPGSVFETPNTQPQGGKGFFEGQVQPTGPREPSTPAPAVRAPYSGEPGTPFKVGFGAGGGRNVSDFPNRPLFSGEFQVKPIEEAPPSSKGGPSGPGYLGPESGIQSPSQETTIRYPPESVFDPTQRFRTDAGLSIRSQVEQQVGFKGGVFPGFFGTPSLSKTLPILPQMTDVLQTPSESQKIPTLEQTQPQTTGQTTIPIQTPVEIPTQTQIPIPTPVFQYPSISPERGSPQNEPPANPFTGISSFPSGGYLGRKSRKKAAFGERQNPINIAFGGGKFDLGSRKKRGRK